MQILSIFFIACVILLIEVDATKPSAAGTTSLYEGKSVEFAPSSTAKRFCFNTGKEKSAMNAVTSFFSRSYISVDTHGDKMPWMSVRGISGDDFFLNLQNLMWKSVFGLNEDQINQLKEVREDIDGYGFLRDLVSSCPSPIYQTRDGNCLMQFSSMDEACIEITLGGDGSDEEEMKYKPKKITVTAMKEINTRGILFFIISILFFYYCHELSKSKICQYIAGMITFITAGILLGIVWLMSKLGAKDRNGERKLNLPIVGAVTATYGWGLMHFMTSFLRQAMVLYWEFTLGYIVIMAICGVIFVRMLRANETTKHVYRVTAKWALRIIGVVFLYNSSASPLAASANLLVFSLYYLYMQALKWGIGSKKKV